MNYLEDRPEAVFDTECFPNYWSIGFQTEDGRRKVFELFDGNPLDKKGIASIFRRYRVFGFNSKKYDIPMTLYAMSGASNAELKHANDQLIQFQVPWWTFLQRVNLEIPDFIDHVDLMEVSPGAPTMPSLKIYAGRTHSRKMQEMPLEIDQLIYAPERQVIRSYHGNDLEVTRDLKCELASQVRLRALMSKEYGVDLRSKSDAQVAEAAIKAELEKVLGRRLYAPDIEPGFFQYKVPSWAKFETVAMRAALGMIQAARFKVDSAGMLHAQDEVKKLNVLLGERTYQMGLGGLHSQEANISHFSTEEVLLLDRDVTSYYPQSILLQGMFPKHLGPAFLKVYRAIYERRVAAKRNGDKNTAETLKIVLNGVFGKLGNVYSIFFSLDLMIQVTLTGQLAILMLIERLTLAGFDVISANTDGIITKVPQEDRWLFNAIFFDWEMETGYTTEETEYISVHSQSVNAYMAFSRNKDGTIKAKRKGFFAPSGPGLDGAAGLKKNPDLDICTEAVIEYLTKGTPIEETIEWCFDPKKFLAVRRVTGGAMKDGEYLGKALRWYHSTEVSGGFVRKDSGNAVPKTIGAKLMMTLLPYIPEDMDYAYYIREAYAILEDVGMGAMDPSLRGRAGQQLARLPDAKNIHLLNLSTGVALCGKARDSIRDAWVELDKIPDGHRMCSKCKKAMI